MKVLFAVNNDKIAESIIRKYQEEYKEIISSKTVYYFNAIIKELQKDKSYDRIVISEDLEMFSNDNYQAIDKFIFEKMDIISDEATNTDGSDVPIIFLCTDRRTKSDPIMSKLFGLGIYGILVGQDRSIQKVCNLLYKPRSKKEAKQYCKVETENVGYVAEQGSSGVSESEIQNIVYHYKKIGNNVPKCVKSFDSIYAQYSEDQVKLIINVLPVSSRLILEENSETYRNLMGIKGNRKSDVVNANDEKDYIEKSIDFGDKLTKPVIIPTQVNTQKVVKIEDPTEKAKKVEEARIAREKALREEKMKEERKAKAEAKRREEIRKAKAEAEAKRKEEERIAKEKAAAEAKRKEEERIAKEKAAAEAKRKEEERIAKEKAAAEAKRKEEERIAKEKAAAEAKRKEEERKAKAAAEAKRKEEERKAKAAAEAKRKEEERKAKAAAEAKRKEEERKAKAAAEAKRKEEERKAKAAAEAKRKEEERKAKAEAETKKKAEQSKKVTESENVETVKRGRGRPRKNPVEPIVAATIVEQVVEKKKRGRPRKNPIVIEEPVEEVVEENASVKAPASKKSKATTKVENVEDDILLDFDEFDNTENLDAKNNYDEDIDLEDEDIDLEDEDFDLEDEDFDIEDEDIDLEDEDIDLEDEDFDVEDEDIDLEDEDIDLEDEDLDVEDEDIDLEDEDFDIEDEDIDLEDEDLDVEDEDIDLEDEDFELEDEDIESGDEDLDVEDEDLLDFDNIEDNAESNETENDDEFDFEDFEDDLNEEPNKESSIDDDDDLLDFDEDDANSEDDSLDLLNFEDEEAIEEQEKSNQEEQEENQNEENDLDLPEFEDDDELKFEEEVDDLDVLDLEDDDEQPIDSDNNGNEDEDIENTDNNHKVAFAGINNKNYKFDDDLANSIQDLKETESNQQNYNAEIDNLITSNQKVVAFVGTSKNGTSFIVNNVADVLAERGIKTAILDLTKNKNAFYTYTNNEEKLRETAYNCLEKLRNGIAEGIMVKNNLSVYTCLPGEDDSLEDVTNTIQTLIDNYSIVLLDCDFETREKYFNVAQEIYLVQTLDVLTIQPLTAFLRDLKVKGILNPSKLRVIVNKNIKVSSITEKMLIDGMSSYNDPGMTYMTELFNSDNIKYATIPFDSQVYIKYLEGLINCKITSKKYPKYFLNSLNRLADMVYPVLNGKKDKNFNEYSKKNKKFENAFSDDTNTTLDKMKKKY